jgi:hypothetical protein
VGLGRARSVILLVVLLLALLSLAAKHGQGAFLDGVGGVGDSASNGGGRVGVGGVGHDVGGIQVDGEGTEDR